MSNTVNHSQFPHRKILARAIHCFAIGSLYLGTSWTMPTLAQSSQTAQTESPATVDTPSAQTTHATRQYQIPAGSLTSVLTQFSTQAGLFLVGASEPAKGKSSPGLSGQYTVEEGFAALLAGTDLRAVKQADGSYTLRGVDDGVMTLAPVKVSADSLRGTTEGSDSYTTESMNTATALNLSIRETPQTISVMSRQEIEDFGLTTIDQVLANTPGVNVITYDNERVEFYARGFVIQNFQYDGMPSNYDGTGYRAGDGLTDMAMYDRVEVIKGANGLMTGTGEPGATINLIRKRPTKEFKGHMTLSAGSWNDYRTEVDVGGSLNTDGSIRARAVGVYRDKDSYMDHLEREDVVIYSILEADLSLETMLTVGGDYQEYNPEGSPFGGTPLFNTNGEFNDTRRSYNPGAAWSSWEQYNYGAFGIVEHNFANDWKVKVQLDHRIKGYEAPSGSIFGSPNLDANTAFLFVGRYEGETENNAADLLASGPFSLFGRNHELVVGGRIAKREWTNETTFANAGYDRNITDYDNYNWNGQHPEPNWAASTAGGNLEETVRENAVFVTTRLNVLDSLKVLIGGRHHEYKSSKDVFYSANTEHKRENVLIPYLGIVYDFSDQLSAYASYTNIFNPQSVQSEQGQTLDPEEGVNHEIGLKGEFLDGRLNASAAWFEVTQDNFAETTGGVTPGGSTAYQGVDGVKTKGVELELSGEIIENLQVHAGFTHKISRKDGEKVSTLNPENLFSIFSTYQLDKLTMGLGARWQSKIWTDVQRPDPVAGGSTTEIHTVSDYLLVDAMARFQVSQELSLSLNVNNLLDKEYYHLLDLYGGSYTWGESRSYRLSLKYEF